MAVTAVADLNGLFSTIYERVLFVAREANLMTSLVTNVSATGWMSRNVSVRPQISATSVGETQDFNSPTSFGKSTLATLTPAEIMAQVVLTDQDQETDPDGAKMDAERELGMAVATKIDVDLLALFSSFATDKGTGAGNSATFATFAAGVSVVNNVTKRSDGNAIAVLHPYHWHDLWLELGKPAATYPSLEEITTQALRDYYITTLLGNVRIFVSSNITVDGSDDCISGIFTRSAIYLDTRRPLRLEPQRDASARAWEINVNAGYACGLVRSTYGVKYTADATAPS
jgi:hypothetical protein